MHIFAHYAQRLIRATDVPAKLLKLIPKDAIKYY